ncbi:unnamed protein product [Ambrosiozyma monospora]|uniref:Unnamed protein product n=1 Tax=Ambrosiozyma monospora TaxID=43982 RepID=A0ACB5T116_AMBMO|nr:unnamed protein product [Ambrosiozyma monospora]
MHGSGTMDLLITVSTSIVYSYSCFSMLVSLVSLEGYPPRVLFSTSAMLFIFVSLGKWAESRAKGNTSTALSKLLSLAPTSCVIVENPSYVEGVLAEKESLDPSSIQQKQIPVELLQKNDIVIVQSGSKIPSDGVCIYGSSEVDESLLTGESLPVPKSAGSKLIGGSLNTHSTLYMKVQLIGSRTQLQQIVQLVRDAQITKAPVQRYADAIAAKFVPAILILSFATLMFWSLLLWVMNVDYIPSFFLNKEGDEVEVSKILQVAISVIVVACPCALGLAAPTAVMVGTGVGASNGILIKGGEVLERASDIDCIVFDKTGTITAGKMKLVGHRFVQADNVDDLTLWSMLHAIECNSEHPVGQAIAKGALHNVEKIGKSIESIKVQEVKNHVGYGISAEVIDERDGFVKTMKIGTAKFIKDESKLTNFSTFQDVVSNYDSDTIASVSHISIDDTYFGYIQLADSLRQDSRKTIEYLKNQGYLVALVTGDNTKTSNYVAKLAGIPLANVRAEALPQDKIEYVERLQGKGLKVAFVGDGINDAPALVQSDLGIAVATGTDIAIAAADIVLLSSTTSDNDPSLTLSHSPSQGIVSVCSALDISRKTFKAIKLNFLLALVYNAVMLPIAMGCLIFPLGVTMHPMFASAAMACSSVSVVLNSLRLKSWKPLYIPEFGSGSAGSGLGSSSFELDLEGENEENSKLVEQVDFNGNGIRRKGLLGKFASWLKNKKRAGRSNKYQPIGN